MYTNVPKNAQRALVAALMLALAWLALRYVLPLLSPFLLALGLALALEKPVRGLTRLTHVSRPVAAGGCVLAALGLLGTLLGLLCGRVLEELKGLVQVLPELVEGLTDTFQRWEARLAAAVRDGGQELILRVSESLTERVRELPGLVSDAALKALPSAASAAPDALLFLATAVLGTYFLSAAWPELGRFAAAQLPPRTLEKARALGRGLQKTILRYFRAQLILMAMTFAELTAAFWLLGVDYALLLALGIALIDALPVLGTGTVLLPWAGYELLTGEVSLGVGLAVTYAGVTLLRSLVQAKLLGDQLGLHPLGALVSLYLGYRVWGVWGMVVFPVGAVTLKQLNDGGMLRLWRTPPSAEGEHDVRDTAEYSRGHGDERPRGHEYPPG